MADTTFNERTDTQIRFDLPAKISEAKDKLFALHPKYENYYPPSSVDDDFGDSFSKIFEDVLNETRTGTGVADHIAHLQALDFTLLHLMDRFYRSDRRVMAQENDKEIFDDYLEWIWKKIKRILTGE